MTRRTLFSALIFVAAFCADRITKLFALSMLQGTAYSVFPGLNFVLSWNRGVSWSLFATDDFWGFWLLTAVITLMVLGITTYTFLRWLLSLSIAWEVLMLAGAWSNLIDRVFYGAVIDFIQLYAGSYTWPVFNIADACIVIGVGGMLLRSWRESRE